jgi:DNA polymerase
MPQPLAAASISQPIPCIDGSARVSLTVMTVALSPEQLLRWHLDAGVDETIGETPVNRYVRSKASPAPVVPSSAIAPQTVPAPLLTEEKPALATAAHLAAASATLADLRTALESYDGCGLKRTCQRTVFADGNSESGVMLIGEAPGADEDRLGLPFVGASGRLLDRMLASIGLDRSRCYITNVVPWRPPGNRKPEPTEVELCLPFIERHIELVNPQMLVLLGGAPANALLARAEAISRLRGQWLEYVSPRLTRPIPTLATYHPAYLLRTPAHKREAWRDFLAVYKRLAGK